MRLGSFALVPFCLLVLSGCASESQFDLQDVASPYAYQYTWERGRIYHSPTGTEMTENGLYDYLAGFTVIYVSESHDSVNDHEVQLNILKAMVARFPGEVALGLEMLRTDSQEDVNRWVSGQMSEKEMMRLWAHNWGPSSYPYYKEILNYVRDQEIPLVALNRPQQSLPLHGNADAGTEGINASPPAPLPDPEVDALDPYYEAYIGAFLSGHEAGPDTYEMFMRGQLLWDETMAESAATFLLRPDNPVSKLLIFAGGNHVRYGFGIPRRLFRRVPVNYTTVSPRVVDYPKDATHKLMDIELPDLPLPAADITWMVGYEDLEDQRITLGIAIAPASGGGVLVKEVYPGSVAARAGLAEGDIIRTIDDAELADTFDLSYEIGRKTPGDTGIITIERGGKLLELNIDFETCCPT
jgi:uncharacterized iron-regulated protein